MNIKNLNIDNIVSNLHLLPHRNIWSEIMLKINNAKDWSHILRVCKLFYVISLPFRQLKLKELSVTVRGPRGEKGIPGPIGCIGCIGPTGKKANNNSNRDLLLSRGIKVEIPNRKSREFRRNIRKYRI